ncbi:sulfur carrier protein ThiS [Labrys wisconsinensis]|uniref:Sulfur carrier protein n=1 Tax=Labrys wisconsinensis TaxID=425677 RepID=A0ABU0J0C9_9HYPH|nr:sulfur carrier protein ThiS [Labrys wisconsinensis]MDQ0467720.1 sulfur carrier protein [Labrys wisconsinensis]
MTIIVNGQARELAAATLDALLEALDLGGAVVATAVNGRFVRAAERPQTRLAEGDAVEILAPMQGG